MKNYPELFRKCLIKERLDRGWTIGELAKKSGVTRQAIQLLEAGDTLPQFKNLIKLADALEVELDYLVGRA